MPDAGPVRLYMSMSLDGYIAGPDDEPGQELGRGGADSSTGSTTGMAPASTARSTPRPWPPGR
jgi:hypothetical protein